MSLNVLTLTGRTTSDIELKTSASGVDYCMFSLAVEDRSAKEKKTYFFRCTAYRGTAKLLSQNVKKGSEIGIQGKLTQSTFTDKQGSKRESIQIVVNDVSFENVKTGKWNSGSNSSSQGYQRTADAAPREEDTYLDFNEDDIPF